MRKLAALLGLITVVSLAVSASPALAVSASPQFSFSTGASGASFTCALDGAVATACTSPKSYQQPVRWKAHGHDDQHFAVATQASTLLGATTVQSTTDSNASNGAQAWSYTASASGTAGSISFYVDSDSTAGGLKLGLYLDASGAPGTLLDTAIIALARAGAWNTANLGGASITSGTKYWLALLGTGGGIVAFRDVARDTVSSPTDLTALPQSFSTGGTWNGYCPASLCSVRSL